MGNVKGRDVNGSMAVSKTAREGSNPSGPAKKHLFDIFNTIRIWAKMNQKVTVFKEKNLGEGEEIDSLSQLFGGRTYPEVGEAARALALATGELINIGDVNRLEEKGFTVG